MSGTNVQTERSPLLGDDQLNGHVQENGYTGQNDASNDEDVPLAKEATTKELLAVMAAIWMGVFFAALGTT
jgi:hypothetical protein